MTWNVALETGGVLVSKTVQLEIDAQAVQQEEAIERARPDAAHFWATHTGAELDLLLLKGSRRAAR